MSEFGNEDKSKGSLLKGLMVAIPQVIAFEIGLGFVLSPQSNLVHRLILFMLGLYTIMTVAFVSKSVLKTMSLGTPVIVIVGFIGPILLPDFFVNLFGLFGNVIPAINELIQLSEAGVLVIDAATLGQIKAALAYSWILDFAITLIVGLLTGISVAMISKIFKAQNALSILTAIIGLILFMIGAVILPYTMVAVSGVSQFGLDVAAGGANLSYGVQLATNGSSTEANEYFEEANVWFDEAASIIQGLNDLGLGFLAGQLGPQYQIIVEGGVVVMKAGTELAQAVGPLMVGFAALQDGFELAGSEFSTSTTLQLLQNEDDFDRGIQKIEDSFENFSAAISQIQAALTTLSEIDQQEFKQAVVDGTGSVEAADGVDLIFQGIDLINVTLDALDSFITPTEATGRAPLIHLLFGVKALADAGDQIGESSNFAGTGGLFDGVAGNLTIVDDALASPELVTFRNYDTSGLSPEIATIHTEMSGAFNFFDDAADIAILMGDFGNAIVPILNTFNTTLSSTFASPDFDLRNITDSEYDANITKMEEAGSSSRALFTTGADIEALANAMDAKAQNESYASVSTAASDFAAQFNSFNLTQNAQNFIYLSDGFTSVFRGAKALKAAAIAADTMQTEITAISQSPGNDTVELQAAATQMQNNLTLLNGSMTDARVDLVYAKNNFTLAEGEGMAQIAKIGLALNSSITHIDNIQGPSGIGQIDSSLNPITLSSFAEISTALTFINIELVAVTGDLASLSIDS